MADFQENPPHPLFPPSDEDDDDSPAPLVSEILIQRAEGGKKVTCPRMFRGEELQSLTDLFAQYGGGEYELIARHNSRISARRRYTIPGPSKPMFDEGLLPQENKPPAPSQVLNNPLQGMGGENGLMGLIMMMMQQMMQQQSAAAQSQTQMFLAMMANNQQQSSDEKAAARAELQANIERERINSEKTMSLMREMMQNKGGGTGEEFSKGVEFMRSFAMMQIETAKQAAGAGGESELEKLLETGLQALQGFMALKEMGAQQAAGAAAQVVNGAAA